MIAWRMSFRVGNNGYEMWPDCLRLGVAAMTYKSLATVDLSQYAEGEPWELWKQMKPTQKSSLKRVAYEMQYGDVIYVKKGPRIVDKGIVQGQKNKRAYKFDSQCRLIDPNGIPWSHQVPVEWSSSFPGVDIKLGRSQQLTVEKLLATDVIRIEEAIRVRGATPPEFESEKMKERARLLEDAYYRESPARLKIIIPRHNKLSNEFCLWLARAYKIDPVQEKQSIDIRFILRGQSVIVELKVCFGAGTARSIREALGQLLEYNHYPGRSINDVWLVILDNEPSSSDREYIDRLRKNPRLPLTIGWQKNGGFSFHPHWP